MKVAKKTGKKSSKKSKEDVVAYLKKMGPLKLRKYAVSVLGIPSHIVDEWNDFDFMVSYCAAKEMGEPLPESENEDDDYIEETEENGDDDNDDDSDDDDDDDDDSDDDSDEGETSSMFVNNPEDAEEEEEEEEEEAPPKTKSKLKAKLGKKKRKGKPIEKASPSNNDETCLQDLLDVITSQGVVLDKLAKTMATQHSAVKDIYIRQEATHKAVSALAKTVFYVSGYLNGFIPKAMKAMKYTPKTSKEIKQKADAASKDADKIIGGLLDPESD